MSDSDMPGLSGTAAAFQAGTGNKSKKKPKEKKEPKQSKPDGSTQVAGITGTNLFTSDIPPLKKGGRIKRTGLALLHKNEYVIPAQGNKHRKKAERKRTVIKH